MNPVLQPDLLAHLALKGAVVLVVALAAGMLLRHVAAARRYALWIAALTALALLPLAMWLLPAWRVLPGVVETPALETEPALMLNDASAPVSEDVPPNTIKTVSRPVWAAKPSEPLFSWPDLARQLPVLWLVVAGLLAARLLWGSWRLRRLERSLRPGNEEMVGLIARDMDLKKTPRVLIGRPDAVPMVWGLWRPRLLLPAGFESWPRAKRRAVLLHELAHLKRGDPLALWAAQWVKALHWFNPLAWVTLRQLRLDQERACDDAALRHGVRASEYAQHLLDLSRHTRLAPGVALCALTITRCSPVEKRVRAILDAKQERGSISRHWLLGLAGLALLTTLPVAMLRAQEAEKKPAMSIEEMKQKVEQLRAARADRQPLEQMLEKHRIAEKAEWDFFRQFAELEELPPGVTVLRTTLEDRGNAKWQFYMKRNVATGWLRSSLGAAVQVDWIEGGGRTGSCHLAKSGGHEVEVMSAGPESVHVTVSKAAPDLDVTARVFDKDIWLIAPYAVRWKELRTLGMLALLPEGARQSTGSFGVMSSVAFCAPHDAVAVWLNHSLQGAADVAWPQDGAFFRRVYQAANDVHIEVSPTRDGKEVRVIVWRGKRSNSLAPDADLPGMEIQGTSQAPAIGPRRRQLISAPPAPAPRRRTLISDAAPVMRLGGSFQQPGVLKPFEEALRPARGGAGLGVRAIAEAMAGVGVEMQLGGDFGGLVFEVERGHALGDVRTVVEAGGDEERRHAGHRIEKAGGAGVDEGLEVRAAGQALDDIGGVLLAGVVLHGGKGGEFTPGGEAENAKTVGFHVPFGGAAADEADGTARIGHGVILNGVGAALFASEAVFQHKGGDTALLEPLGERVAFVAEAELGMAAAGTDDDGGAGAFFGRRDEGGDRGVVNVADVAALDGLGLGGAGLGAGGALFPKGDGLWKIFRQAGGERGCGGNESNEGGESGFHGMRA